MSSDALLLTMVLLGDLVSGTRPDPSLSMATQAPTTAPSETPLDYPLGPGREPDLLGPGEPFKLVDLRYGVTDTNGTAHTFGARLRVKDWGYLGAESQGERRGLTITSQRLALEAFSQDGTWALSGRFRAPRFILSADAERLRTVDAWAWWLEPSLSVRLSRDLEVSAAAGGDTRRPEGRSLTRATFGFLWQWRAHLDVEGQYRREYTSTDSGSENTVDGGALWIIAQVGGAELWGRGFLTDTDGRFPRREMAGVLGARVPLATRLLLEADAGGGFESGASTQSHEYRGSLTWFARRVTLPRARQTADRSLALARSATAAGYNERRVFDDGELRDQRERLSLARRREELREDITALHQAQVTERPVPVFGLEARDDADALSGASSRAVIVFVGIPWPPAWPWQGNDAAVPFLKVGFAREHQTSGLGFDADTNRLSLTVALNREMDLEVAWSRAEPTALDVIRGVGKRTTFAVSYVYAFGR